MRVFISWSGERSEAVARALRDWLPDVIQGVEPWLSASDIEAGARWNRNVEEALSASRFGVLCVTQTNQTAPWLLFEAGALAKTIEDTHVCPYLVDLEPSELAAGPLAHFQAKRANEQGTFDLVRAINSAMKESGLPAEKLERAFQRWWPDLGAALEKLPAPTEAVARRSRDDVVDEILVSVRELVRRAREEERYDELEARGFIPLSKWKQRRHDDWRGGNVIMFGDIAKAIDPSAPVLLQQSHPNEDHIVPKAEEPKPEEKP